MTTVESKIREAAQMIGMPQDDRLEGILSRMKEEFVVHTWQLSALECAEWKMLGAPIGLAVAVRKTADRSPDTSSTSHNVSPTRSIDDDLLALGGSHVDGVFEDDENDGGVDGGEHNKSLETSSDDDPNLPPQILNVATSESRKNNEMMTSAEVFSSISEEKENKIDIVIDEREESEDSETDDNLCGQNIGSVIDPATMTSTRKKRRSSLSDLMDPLIVTSAVSPLKSAPYMGSLQSAHRSFHEEWDEVQTILRKLCDEDQRFALCQLIIVANGQSLRTRTKLVENVVKRIREIFQGQIEKDELDLVTDHLRYFARLRSAQRKQFGKVLFSALSRLHHSPDRGSPGGKKELSPKEKRIKET